jgi:asparagine synthase (glutamine-hydrolysing)
MFTVELDLFTRAVDWRAGGAAWQSSSGSVAPLAHEALECFALSDAARQVFVCRERGGLAPVSCVQPLLACTHDEYDACVRACRQWPLNWQFVEIAACGGEVRVRFECGSGGAVPLYIAKCDSRVRAHWDMAQLLSQVTPRLNEDRVASYLFGHIPYGAQTLFEDVKMLTRGAALVIAPHTLDVQYPAADFQSEAGQLRAGVDVAAEFEQLVVEHLYRAVGDIDERMTFEVSGGLDSSSVALMGAKVAQRMRTCGLILPGLAERFQRLRRSEVVRLCGAADHAEQAHNLVPFARNGTALLRRAWAPLDETYSEAFDHLFSRLAHAGHLVALTGTGGDELFIHAYRDRGTFADLTSWLASMLERSPRFLSAYARERFRDTVVQTDRAPASWVADSALVAQASRAPLFVRAGLWPVHLFTEPALAHFCRRLPREWCESKRLLEAICTRHGARLFETRKAYPETFRTLFDAGLRLAAPDHVANLFRDLRPALRRFVDVPALCAAYARWLKGDTSVEPFPFYQIAVLEQTLRCPHHSTPARRFAAPAQQARRA